MKVSVLLDLLLLPQEDLAAILVATDTATLIRLAQPRSMRRLKSRKAAIAVINDEAAMYIDLADAGTH
jgi:hypothetical protein